MSREVKPSEIDAVLKKNARPGLLQLYAPTCASSKDFHPAWETLAAKYENSTDITLFRVNIALPGGAELKKKHDVTTTPAVLYFAKGNTEVHKYMGSHQEDTIALFVASKGDSDPKVGLKNELEALWS